MSSTPNFSPHWHNLTEGLNADQISRILSVSSPIEARAGQIIFRTDDVAVSMFLVVRGLLRIIFKDKSGDVSFTYLVRPGDHFGAANLLVAGPRHLTAEAVTDVELLSIAKHDFDELMVTVAPFAANVCRSLANWVVRKVDARHPRVSPNVVAFLRISPLTHGIPMQVVAALAEEEDSVLIVTDRPAAWSAVRCEVRTIEVAGGSDDQFEAILPYLTAALQMNRQVFFDLLAEHAPPKLLSHCDETWLMERSGGDVDAVIHRLVRPAPVLADRLWLIRLIPLGERLPAASHGQYVSNREIRVRFTGTDGDARLQPGCVARLKHRLQGLHIGLALGGGGALGAAHIGAIRAFERAGLYFDRVAGTSIGSVVAAGYAAGFSADELANLFLHELSPPRWIRYVPKGNLWYLLANYRCGLFERKLRRHLFDYTFDRLLLPLHTLTVDLRSGQEVVRDQGDVTQAVLESINLPGVSKPIRRDGQALVDGGILNNVPADVLRARHTNFVVAVHLLTELGNDVGSQFWQLLIRILKVQMRQLEVDRRPAIDVAVTPKLAAFPFEDFSRSAELIEAGEEAGEKMIPEIRRRLAEIRASQKL